MIASVACLLAVVFGACCILLAAFIGSLLYMVVLHHRLKAQGLARERALLAAPLPPDAELPHVVVQIPSFNEGSVVRRGVEAAVRLDWPRDKLHIQILDDSTDETAEIARTVAAEMRGHGFDVVALQRTDRSGYKGGALHEAMQQTPHDYFAIFDVDYVPPVDFLRRCMRVFVAEPKDELTKDARKRRLLESLDKLLTEAVHLGFSEEEVARLVATRSRQFQWNSGKSTSK